MSSNRPRNRTFSGDAITGIMGRSKRKGHQPSEEEYGDSGPTVIDARNWRVEHPSDDLDQLMWGEDGVPPPVSPMARFSKTWARQEEGFRGGNRKSDVDGSIEDENDISNNHADEVGNGSCDQNDNIFSALSSSKDEIDATDNILLDEIVWKQRSGFGKYSLGILSNEWEQRRVVLFESGKLRYYSLPPMEPGKYDPDHVYNSDTDPRGEMDIRRPTDGDDSVDIDNSTSSNGRLIRWNSRTKGGGAGVTIKARQRHDDPGPTPFEIDITRKDTKDMWRFCFLSRSSQMEWLSLLKNVAGDPNQSESTEIDTLDSESFDDHGFEAGDHIIRWEMLPILYPIQIHGIVLEAGKNCVIIADFGLASHHNGGARGLNTWSDEADKESHDVIVAAWEKIKPKEKKRLNVIVVTDPKEIRKWSKVSYSDQVGDGAKKKKKHKFLPSLFSDSPGKSSSKKSVADEKVETSEDTVQSENEIHDEEESDDDSLQDDEFCSQDQHSIEGEPEWFHARYKSRQRTKSTSSRVSYVSEGQSVFSIDQAYDRSKMSELPKSDSAKIVLARTHFILENENLLPPYHVFYSNSECIAVWCKTGRWSTLQAAVYLVSSSLGLGKSATMLTISVAAANLVLLPALVVGGLAVVGAPLLYLKKSQAKWEKTTKLLTDEFWSRAGPDVFVEAIEYWGRLRKES